MAQLLYRAPPVGVAALTRCIQDSVIVWIPVSGNVFNQIQVSLTYGDNLPIPPAALPADDFTTLDILIRRVR